MILPRILSVFLLAASAAGKEPSFDEVNTACGVSLFMDENLWDDEATAVAARLGTEAPPSPPPSGCADAGDYAKCP